MKKIIKIYFFQKHKIQNMLNNFIYDFKVKSKKIEKKEVKSNIVIDLIVPLYNTPIKYFEQMLQSVIKQNYKNWNLILVDASNNGNIKEFLDRKEILIDKRIKYFHIENNLGIAQNTNYGLEKCSGDYIGFLDHDDFLELDALSLIVTEIENNSKIEVIYTNEDKYNSNTNKYELPYNKTDLDMLKLRCNNYICHFLIFSRELYKKIGGEDSKFDGAQDYDFILRAIEKAKVVKHLQKTVYHWRIHSHSTAGNPNSKIEAYENGRLALINHFNRQGILASVIQSPYYGYYQIRYLESIPNKNNICIVFGVEDIKKINLTIQMENTFDSIIFYTNDNTYYDYKNNKIRNSIEFGRYDYCCFVNSKLLKNELVHIIKNSINMMNQNKISATSIYTYNKLGIVSKKVNLCINKSFHYKEVLPNGENILPRKVDKIRVNCTLVKLSDIVIELNQFINLTCNCSKIFKEDFKENSLLYLLPEYSEL